MASYAKFDVWQDSQGNAQNTVLQVVKTSLGDDLGTTSNDNTNNFPAWVIYTNTTTWTTTNNLQLTITPKFSNSLIRLDLCVSLGISAANNSCGLRVIRGEKIVFRPMHNTTGPFDINYHSAGNEHGQRSFIFYDEPNTVETITYSLQYRAYSSANSVAFFGWTGSGHYAPLNTFSAMEIAR